MSVFPAVQLPRYGAVFRGVSASLLLRRSVYIPPKSNFVFDRELPSILFAAVSFSIQLLLLARQLFTPGIALFLTNHSGQTLAE